jgi:N-acetyl-alpha-D-muramate 1-phosphate uridylyltransferase
MQAVILAGGLGTRMRPFTETAPKCLLPVRGRPFIDYQLELLKAGGVREIVLCLGYLGEMVESYLGDGGSRGMKIVYSWDSADSGGTAGALKHAEPLLDKTFFLTWGDSYVRVDHAAMFAAHCAGAPEVVATMGVFCNQNAYDSSNVQVGANKVVRYVKGAARLQLTHIDAGISVFERSALQDIPEKQNIALDQFFSSWAASGRLGAYPVAQRFYEVGSQTGLEDFEKFVADDEDRLA